MHDAYECAQLAKLGVQIESLAAADDKLLIGTRQGHLITYSVTPGYGDTKHDLKLTRYCKTFSKKPINQLAVVPDFDLVIKLSDNVVTTHDLSDINCPLLQTLGQTRGATLFCLESQPNVSLTGKSVVFVKLAVCVKRKLQIYYLKQREFLVMDDVTLPDTPRSLAWVGESVCVGFKASYSLVQIHKKEVKELFPTGRQPEPIVIKVNEGFALSKETNTIFLDSKGDPNSESAVKWPEMPVTLGFDEPYLIGVLPETVEVACWGLETPVDITPFPIKAKMFARAKSGVVYLASTELVWLLSAIPLHRQIKILLQKKNFELALKIANVADDSEEEKQKNIHQIQTLYAFDLFHSKKYEKSMAEFLKLNTNPYEVIKLFPGLVSQSNEETDNEGDMEESGYVALIKYLTHVRLKLMAKTPESDKEVIPKKSESLMQIIDTTLLKCYLQTNDALVAPVLRRNYCNLEEAERTLKKWRKDPELVILYQSKGLHDKALDLLKKQASVQDSPLFGVAHTIHYLQSLGKDDAELIFKYASWAIEDSPEEGLKIFTEEMREDDHLPRPKVLDFLLKTNKPSLVISYLEHVIHSWKERSSIFHNALVHQYRERVEELGLENPHANTIRSKLLKFLETSDYYSPDAVLIHFPRDRMFEERALINGKLGRHEHTLGIYLLVLGDRKKALDYCDKVYTTKGATDVYVEVLKLLTCPPDELPGVDSSKLQHKAPDLDTALVLLEAYPDRLPPLETLEQLPNYIPVGQLTHYLEAALLKLTSERRSAQLLNGLLKTQKLEVTKQKIELEAKKVVIDEYMVCPICKKRFGNQSAFVCYPNGKVVHYSCQDKM